MLWKQRDIRGLPWASPVINMSLSCAAVVLVLLRHLGAYISQTNITGQLGVWSLKAAWDSDTVARRTRVCITRQGGRRGTCRWYLKVKINFGGTNDEVPFLQKLAMPLMCITGTISPVACTHILPYTSITAPSTSFKRFGYKKLGCPELLPGSSGHPFKVLQTASKQFQL